MTLVLAAAGMGGIVSFLIALLIFCVVLYAIYTVINFLSLPQPIRNLALIIVGIIGLLWLFQRFGGSLGI